MKSGICFGVIIFRIWLAATQRTFHFFALKSV